MVDACERTRGLGTGFGRSTLLTEGINLTNSPVGKKPFSSVRRFLPFSQPVNHYMWN